MKRHHVFVAVFTKLILLLSGILFYLREFPTPSVLFPLFYNMAPSKSDYLQSYRDKLWDHGGGYISRSVQKFLVSRLEAPQSCPEVDAIAAFYAKQARGREYGLPESLSTSAKNRLIDALFRVPAASESDHMAPLFLIEEVRRGQSIGKGYFYVVSYPRFAHYLRLHPV